MAEQLLSHAHHDPERNRRLLPAELRSPCIKLHKAVLFAYGSMGSWEGDAHMLPALLVAVKTTAAPCIALALLAHGKL